MRVFAGRLRSVARAEDLIQTIYERLLAVGAEEDIVNPLAYLYRLGNNLLLDDLRRERRQRSRELGWSDLQGERVGAARAAEAPSPEASAISRQRLEHLLRAAKRLPPQTHRAFTLHKLQGLSHAETADAMGISKSAVEKHMSLALKLLSERLR